MSLGHQVSNRTHQSGVATFDMTQDNSGDLFPGTARGDCPSERHWSGVSSEFIVLCQDNKREKL